MFDAEKPNYFHYDRMLWFNVTIVFDVFPDLGSAVQKKKIGHY